MDHPPLDLCDSVRRHCAAVAASAEWVSIDLEAQVPEGGAAGLDPELHFLDGTDEAVALYVLALDAINFGSAWLGDLHGSAIAGTVAITDRLTRHARVHGPWTGEALRQIDAAELARTLDLPAHHELADLYATALAQLGDWLAGRSALEAIAGAGGSAVRFAQALVDGMPFFDDVGYYKRAQITANDLMLAGVADFGDADLLTIFADNIVPHVLRMNGVLVYEPALAARIDGGEVLPAGSQAEHEIRACALHACEHHAQRLGVPSRTLDNWLWNRGAELRDTTLRPHRTYTIHY